MNYRFITGKRVSLNRNKQPSQYPHQPPRHDPTTNSMTQSSKHDPPMFQTSWKLQQRSWFFPSAFKWVIPPHFPSSYSSLPFYCYLALCNILYPHPGPKFWSMTAHCAELYDFPLSVAMFATHSPVWLLRRQECEVDDIWVMEQCRLWVEWNEKKSCEMKWNEVKWSDVEWNEFEWNEI